MNESASKRSVVRIVLVVLLVLALIVLAVVATVLLPILTHRSSGGSGQEVPTGFVSESSATGADGRTRMLKVTSEDGEPADLAEVRVGDELIVSGHGFDSGIGIYVSFCAIPENAETKPGPCLGGIPEGAEEGDLAVDQELSSAWVTNDWAWRAFASHTYDNSDEGTFEVHLTVPEPVTESLDCTVQQCAIVTRADHTAANDRVQDMVLPVAFAQE
ncbi:hypothetical protein [Leucobacter denitrificans]|uniref:Uncharacterized protein n=1 Tax=Leucobacter denitrificans TaxID=683042 RepID=A0A7G9S3S7_9MICO|nr:hypothetical protein [Leucobacter denitrificans]QNN62502.1 hypothetical protein H9L06_09650 [Leucobacter denitrificans]